MPARPTEVGELIALPAFRVSCAIAEDLLAGSPYTLDDLDQLGAPTRLATTRAHGERVPREQEHTGAQMCSDCCREPIRRRATRSSSSVLTTTHAGVDPDGTIYNGANDNASGVAVMLEIARLCRPKAIARPAAWLFRGLGCREQGLLGATHYVSAPVYPLDSDSGYLNLDMAGVGAASVSSMEDNNAMAINS